MQHVAVSPLRDTIISTETFPQFSILPPELQLHVWSFAALPAKTKSILAFRGINLLFNGMRSLDVRATLGDLIKHDLRLGEGRFASRWAMMGTCAQSRDVALKICIEDLPNMSISEQDGDWPTVKDEILALFHALRFKVSGSHGGQVLYCLPEVIVLCDSSINHHSSTTTVARYYIAIPKCYKYSATSRNM